MGKPMIYKIKVVQGPHIVSILGGSSSYLGLAIVGHRLKKATHWFPVLVRKLHRTPQIGEVIWVEEDQFGDLRTYEPIKKRSRNA